MSHDEMNSLVAGYVLLALGPEDREALEAHLPACEICTRSVAELEQLAGCLPLLVEQRQPPRDLEERILSAVRAQGSVKPKLATWAPNWKGFVARRMTAVATVAVVAVVAVTVIGLALLTLLPQDDTPITQAKLDRTHLGIDIMAKADQWWRVPAGGAIAEVSGSLAYSEEHASACLVVWGLPTDQGLVYQAWSVKQGVPTSLGRMWGMGSASWLILPGDPSDLGSLQITSERARGPATPQGAVVFTVNFGDG